MSDNDLLYIPSDPNAPFKLGRNVVWHDPRNKNYRAIDAVRGQAPVRWYPWSRTRGPFDQIDSNCTTEGAVGLLLTQPHTRMFVRHHLHRFDTEPERVAFYVVSKDHDPWSGNQYDGTSTDAPFKLLKLTNVIAEYRWLFGIEELIHYLQHFGAAVVGTNWYQSMFEVDSKGFIHIKDSMGMAGGHAYEVIFFHPRRKYFEIVNSWGPQWGRKGRARIDMETMARLLAEQGEACTVPSGSVRDLGAA